MVPSRTLKQVLRGADMDFCGHFKILAYLAVGKSWLSPR
jgi:hypothetical protein